MISFTSTIAVAVSAAFFPGRPPACAGETVFSLHAIMFSLYAIKNFSVIFQSASYRCITRSFSISGHPGSFSMKKLCMVFHLCSVCVRRIASVISMCCIVSVIREMISRCFILAS